MRVHSHVDSQASGPVVFPVVVVVAVVIAFTTNVPN